MKRNGDLSRAFCKSTDNMKDKGSRKELGIFHRLSDEMRISLLKLATEDAPVTRKNDIRSHATQRAENQQKEELLRENIIMMKASEAFVDALYYHEMYGSAKCWRTADMVNCELGKLTSNKSKIDALKENIRMRVLGLG